MLVLPPLPAAATSTTPEFQALLTAVCRVVDVPTTKLMLMTWEPFLTAQLMPFAKPELDPAPVSLRIFPARMEHPGQTPATPMPLPAVAATIPATCVPWP